MKLNVKAVLVKEAEKKAQSKPLPVIKMAGTPCKIETVKPVANLEPVSETIDHRMLNAHVPALLLELNAEMSRILKERRVYSTRTAHLVDEIEKRLRKESPGIADAFLAGDVPMPELVEHYVHMQNLTNEAAEVFDKIRYVEQYGKLPVQLSTEKLATESEDVSALHHHIRRLDDLIYKTIKKLSGVQPKNSERVALWKEKLAMAEAERDELKRKLKRLQYDARAERTSAE